MSLRKSLPYIASLLFGVLALVVAVSVARHMDSTMSAILVGAVLGGPAIAIPFALIVLAVWRNHEESNAAKARAKFPGIYGNGADQVEQPVPRFLPQATQQVFYGCTFVTGRDGDMRVALLSNDHQSRKPPTFLIPPGAV